ncbi:hypothetical protein Cfor_03731 [Coptotermes formosanus]|jgi:hypothetical protein|uniref:PiggyBac transposable element-derived protein domain-containing protein n=1 Tax=Coptotermes formosanus TaxID=36987 RepID=A0A6L2PA87_COPFO|nr:hypothetical protein Cfor_03731 [Coptotermes formosanus]
MAHAKGLTDKAVEDILLNSDSEEDFGSDNNSESSDNGQYKSQSVSEAEHKLPTVSGAATTALKKQKVEGWKWNPSCSSPDKPTQKPFRGDPGINSNVTGLLSEEVRPVHIFSMFMESDFWLHLVAQVNKYAASTTVQNDSDSLNSDMESKWFDTTVDELKAFISLCIMQSCVKKRIPFKHIGALKSPQRLHFFSLIMTFKRYKLMCKFLHFVDNATLDASDRLVRVRYPNGYFNNNKFQTLYTPMQDIAIDESLMKLHGRL